MIQVSRATGLGLPVGGIKEVPAVGLIPLPSGRACLRIQVNASFINSQLVGVLIMG